MVVRARCDEHAGCVNSLVLDIAKQMNAMPACEIDPEGPLGQIGKVQSVYLDETCRLLAAFHASLNQKMTP